MLTWYKRIEMNILGNAKTPDFYIDKTMRTTKRGVSQGCEDNLFIWKVIRFCQPDTREQRWSFWERLKPLTFILIKQREQQNTGISRGCADNLFIWKVIRIHKEKSQTYRSRLSHKCKQSACLEVWVWVIVQGKSPCREGNETAGTCVWKEC